MKKYLALLTLLSSSVFAESTWIDRMKSNPDQALMRDLAAGKKVAPARIASNSDQELVQSMVSSASPQMKSDKALYTMLTPEQIAEAQLAAQIRAKQEASLAKIKAEEEARKAAQVSIPMEELKVFWAKIGNGDFSGLEKYEALFENKWQCTPETKQNARIALDEMLAQPRAKNYFVVRDWNSYHLASILTGILVGAYSNHVNDEVMLVSTDKTKELGFSFVR